jgi:hypothetical protein
MSFNPSYKDARTYAEEVMFDPIADRFVIEKYVSGRFDESDLPEPYLLIIHNNWRHSLEAPQESNAKPYAFIDTPQTNDTSVRRAMWSRMRSPP